MNSRQFIYLSEQLLRYVRTTYVQKLFVTITVRRTDAEPSALRSVYVWLYVSLSASASLFLSLRPVCVCMFRYVIRQLFVVPPAGS